MYLKKKSENNNPNNIKNSKSFALKRQNIFLVVSHYNKKRAPFEL